jgi:hypothetical protein
MKKATASAMWMAKLSTKSPARLLMPIAWGLCRKPPTRFTIPAEVNVTVTIDGSSLDADSETDLVLIGPGFTIGVEEIILEPGQVDRVQFFPGDQMIVYETDTDESPFIVVGSKTRTAPITTLKFRAWICKAAAKSPSGSIPKPATCSSAPKNSKTKAILPSTCCASLMNDEEFYAEGILLRAGATIYVNYAEWTDANSEGLYIDVDLDGDGEIDDVYDIYDSE